MAEEPGGQAATTFTQAQVDEMVAGLKSKNSELLGKVKSYDERLKPYEGLDPAKAREALTAAEKAEAEAAKARGDWDANEKRLRDQWAAEHTKVVDPLKSELDQTKAELFEAVAVRDALEAMSSKDVLANPKLAMPLIRHELGTEVIDGKRVTVIKGVDGKARYHPTTGLLVTVADRLKELRTVPDYAGAFQSPAGSGGGAEQGARQLMGGIVTLTREQASDHSTYQAALKSVNGDYTKLKVAAA